MKQANKRREVLRAKTTTAVLDRPATSLELAVLAHPDQWPQSKIYIALAAATVLCLLPFVGKAFHLDDPLFLFSAKQIVRHPLDPFGFPVVWETTAQPMAQVTKNPPLACYYAALIGSIAGWSEVALHLGFMLPAIAVVLGTYRLAARFTKRAWLAALLTLFAPGFLVSASSIMCDTLMLALWIWAIIFWVEGLELHRPWLLITSSLLLTAASLAKYFGVALIPLLLAYSIIRQRSMGHRLWGWWMACFAIPCVALAGYELWTAGLYGQGLLSSSAEYASVQKQSIHSSMLGDGFVDLSFAGGCALPALALFPLLWSRKQIFLGALASIFAVLAFGLGWLDFGQRVGSPLTQKLFHAQWPLLAAQFGLYVAAGVSILGLVIAAMWKQRDADSWLLALWILGTLVFAGFVNWTINARSVLPLIPAVAILIAQRVESAPTAPRWSLEILCAGVAVTALMSLWVCAADAGWANSARDAAVQIRERTRNETGTVFFVGHWGFQYYMQEFGFKPADEANSSFQVGDLVVVPQKNTSYAGVDDQFLLKRAQPNLDVSGIDPLTTMDAAVGAGFYSAYWGPLPFAFGRQSPDDYAFLRLVAPRRPPGSN